MRKEKEWRTGGTKRIRMGKDRRRVRRERWREGPTERYGGR